MPFCNPCTSYDVNLIAFASGKHAEKGDPDLSGHSGSAILYRHPYIDKESYNTGLAMKEQGYSGLSQTVCTGSLSTIKNYNHELVS